MTSEAFSSLPSQADADRLFEEQLAVWPETRQRYEELAHIRTHDIRLEKTDFRLQFNPARIRSTGAKVDEHSIARRPCFLCSSNRPAKQLALPCGPGFELLVNPFPIFPRHYTIVARRHMPQRIAPYVELLLALAERLTHCTVFYNGPASGASAPDHLHFQAGTKGLMPVEEGWKHSENQLLATRGTASLLLLNDRPCTTLVVRCSQRDDACTLLSDTIARLPLSPSDGEPRLNLLARSEPADGGLTVFLFPRTRHRPTCYTAPEEEHRILVSPGAADMGGLLILPREEDYLKLTLADAERIFADVSLPRQACLDSLSGLLSHP